MNFHRIALKISSSPGNPLFNNQHSLQDVLDGKYPVGVEGDSGNDIKRAKMLGMFTCNVNGIYIFAKCEADARPLVQYLERGGTYGSLEFSKLLGYTNDQIEYYRNSILNGDI